MKVAARKIVYCRRYALPRRLARCNLCGHLLTKLWARVVASEARAVSDAAGVRGGKCGAAGRVATSVKLTALAVAVSLV